MTLREFFERLPKDGWNVNVRGYIRRCGRCPICAASENYLHTLAWPKAAAEMGLDCDLGQRIADAADGYVERKLSKRLLRRLLLKHCGLSEVKS